MIPFESFDYRKVTAGLLTFTACLLPYIFLPAYTPALYFGDGYTAPKAVFLLLMATLIAAVYLFGRLTQGGEKESWFSLVVFLLFLTLSVSTAFSKYPHLVLFGNFRRLEGYLILVTYLLFLYTAHQTFTRKDVHQLVKLLLFTSMPIALFGLLQYYGIEPFPLDYWKKGGGSAIVTIGNRNMTGTYAALLLSLAIGKYLEKPSKAHWFFASMLFALLIAAMTRGTWLGIGLAGLMVAFRFRNFSLEHRRQIITLLLTFVLIFGLMSLDTGLVKRFVSIGGEVEKAFVDSDSMGSGRGTIYKNTFPLLKEHLLLGSGPETFQEVFDQESWYAFRKSRSTFVDRAHSEPLHQWVTLGLPYLLLYTYLVFRTLKTRANMGKSDPLSIGLTFAVLTYYIQSLFNISVLSVAPLYYLLLGLPLVHQKEEPADTA